MSNNKISPFIKRCRSNGGTIYTFSSAVEDIGLNINERNNLVKISHFALLDIPNISESSIGYYNNTFNVRNIVGCWEHERNNVSIKDGRVLIAESFQNYALNLESNLLNRDTSSGVGYNPSLIRTVSERVFWKWLKETGSIRWVPDVSASGQQYWTEEIDTGGNYTNVVKYVGQVSAGNVRIDNYGTYNETYVLIPTSHGQTNVYFKQIEDDNYFHGIQIGDLGENILGREGYTKPHPDGLSMSAYYDFVDSSTLLIGGNQYYLQYDPSDGIWHEGWWYSAYNINPAVSYTDNVYLTDSSAYKQTGIYHTDLRFVPTLGGNNITFRRSNIDCISLEFDLNNLTDIYKINDPTLDQLTWDKAATEYAINDAFTFNAALIYYSVYTQTGEILAINLLGVMFLDAPSGNSSDITTSGIGIQLPSLEKIMSGPAGFGTSYSLRLNIKTDNMLDDTTATIVDYSTSDQLWAEDWVDVIANLDKAVNLLTQQNATFNFISGQYITIQGNQTQIENQIISLSNIVNDISRDIQGTAGTLALFSDGDDPLVDSSIYMKFGKIGIFNTDPQYAVDIDGSIKTKDITIENAIRDTSGNILLGYGSPLTLGASTNYREVEIYTGNINPVIQIDTSNHVNINGDVSILNQLSFESSVAFNENVTFNGSLLSDQFDFTASYVRDTSAGTGLVWQNGFLNATGDVSVLGDGSIGSIQFISDQGILLGDSSFYFDNDTKRLGLNLRNISTLGTLAILQQGNTYEDGIYLTTQGQTPFEMYVNSTNRINFSRAGTTFLSALGLDVSLYNNLNIGNRLTVNRLRANTLQIDGSVALSGIPSSAISNVLYYNPKSKLVSYGTQFVTAYTNGVDNRVITSTSATGINGEANLTFNGALLSVTGAIQSSTNVTTPIIRNTTDLKIGSATTNVGMNWVLSTQRFGINNDAPSYTLDINGTLGAVLTADSTPSNILYYNTSTRQFTYGANAASIVTTYTNGVNNRIITSTGASGINGEADLTFDGINLYLGSTIDKTIGLEPINDNTAYDLNINGQTASSTGPTGGNLYVKSGDGNTTSGSGNATGGNLYLYAGDGVPLTGTGYGGDIIIKSGIGTRSNNGKIYLGTIPSSSATISQILLGSTYSETAPPLSFNGESNMGITRYTYGKIGVSTLGTLNFLFDVSTFHARGSIVANSGAFSDKRLKTNIVPIQDSLNKVLELKGIEYDDIDGNGHHTGFIAQEVEKIIPEIVFESTPIGKDINYKAIRYTELIPYLAEAIKQQQKQINNLEKEIKKLKKS